VIAPWIYLAGPLFTQAETAFNQQLAALLRSEAYQVYLPQEECLGITDPSQLFGICLKGLNQAALVLVILDGADADSGSCFEMGFAYAQGIPIIGLRTDFRGSGDHLGLNLMLTHACSQLILTTLTPLLPQTTNHVTYFPMGEDFSIPLLAVLAKNEAAQHTKTR